MAAPEDRGTSILAKEQRRFDMAQPAWRTEHAAQPACQCQSPGSRFLPCQAMPALTSVEEEDAEVIAEHQLEQGPWLSPEAHQTSTSQAADAAPDSVDDLWMRNPHLRVPTGERFWSEHVDERQVNHHI